MRYRSRIDLRQLTKCVLGMALCLGFAANVFADEFVGKCVENAKPPFDEETAIYAYINEVWPVYVQAVRGVEADECPLYPLYVLKKAENIPDNYYERIEPILLDQYSENELSAENDEFTMTLPQEQRLGFVAHRNGVNVLLNSRSERIIPDEFDGIGFDVNPNIETILVQIRRGKHCYPGEEECAHIYLRFQDGRLLQRAPRWYQEGGYAWSGLDYQKMVVLGKENKRLEAP
ncbi:MAG: hypothetical protein LBJ59_03060 [Zoogloeaceae bacterium]|jgi:hypothetical protein|nr:hypothetical protein [Zoogloeaceae bacterium]